jgi:hypothetical protein
MKLIKYIFQISLFLIFLLPTVSNADTIKDPIFEICGIFPSALNTWSDIKHQNGNIVLNNNNIYAESSTGGANIQCSLGGTTQDCTVESMSQPIPTLPIFILSPITKNHIASGTESDEKYGDMTIPSNTTVTLRPSGRYETDKPVMLIRSLTIEDGATLVFDEGDYWIGEWINGANIKIRTTGKTRIFINGNLTLIEDNIDFNYNNGSSLVKNLFVFVYGNVIYTSSSGDTDMSGYLYTQGSFIANHSTGSHFKGAVTAVKGITITNNQRYQYDYSGLTTGEWGECDSGIVYPNADDLCYSSITYSGHCIGMGEFRGGIGCEQTINIRNLSGKDINNRYDSLFILDHTGATVTLQNQCGIDGETRSDLDDLWCYSYDSRYDSAIDMSVNGMPPIDNYVVYGGIYYTDSKDEFSIFTKSAVSASLFSGNNLYAKYIKDSIHYSGEVYSCDVKVEFELDGYEIAEDIDRMYLTETVNPIIKLNRAVDYDVTVSYYTSDGTAKSSLGDYIAKSGTVTIPAGERRATLEIFIYNDQPIEIQEEFFVTLRNPSNGVGIGYNERTKIVILEQDDAPTCFEDNFDDGVLNEEWRVLSATGGFIPHIVHVGTDGRLRVTDGQERLSTVVTRDVEFESSQNLIIVEFEYYAYGGCGAGHDGLGTYGADGIVNILFDSTVGDSPTPGGSGGSMGYAQYVNNTPGFEGGWLGLGLDEYGNYGRDNEGRDGGSTSRIENNAVIRGSGSGMNGYKYLDSVKLTDDGVGQLGRAPIAIKATNDYYSGLYKMVVDARDPAHLYINLMRTTTHSENDYATIISQFDAKDPIYAQGATPEKIRYAVSSGTGGGCNNHELSWLKLRGNCSNYDPSGSYSTGPFASQDMWRNVGSGDFNISTKLVNEPFNIKLLSLDETHRATEVKDGIDARWTLKYMNASNKPFLYKSDDGVSYNNILFDSSQYRERSSYNMLNNNSIVVDKAYKDMYIEITYCAEYDSTTNMKKLYAWSMCGEDTSGAISENREEEGRRYYIHEGDHFAVRPSYFQLFPRNGSLPTDATHIHAGKDYNLTLCAFDGVSDTGNCGITISNLVKEYNQNISNLTLQKRIRFNDGEIYNSTATRDNKHKFSLDGTLTFNSDALTALVNGQSRFIDSSGNPTGSPRAMGVTFDNVGQVEVGVKDETWAVVDIDDSPSTCMTKSQIVSIQSLANSATGAREPFSRVVCMGSSDDNLTLTFIPDHFEIKNSTLTNHRGGDFTYIASKGTVATPEIEPLMSGSIAMTIEAQNSEGNVVTNFTKESTGSYPIEKDTKLSTDAYYENPITVTFDIDEEQNPLAIAGDSDYKLNKIQIEDKTLLGFERGIYTIGINDKILSPFYLRKNNEAVNPFDINSSEVTLKILSVYPSETLSTDGNITDVNSKISFYYARVAPIRYFYEDITEDSIQTPVMINIYCDPFTDPNQCQYPAIDPVGGATNENRWYRAKLHRADKNDGNVTINKGTILEGSGSPSLSIGDNLGNRVLNIRSTDGSYTFINVNKGSGATLPMTVTMELADVATPAMSPWLIYGDTLNGISSDKPEPFYKVRFIDSSSWTGIGTDGSIVDRDTGISKNRRMDW